MGKGGRKGADKEKTRMKKGRGKQGYTGRKDT